MSRYTGRRLFLLFLLAVGVAYGEPVGSEKVNVKVGVVLDLNSTLGMVAQCSMRTAISQFYADHPSYRTRLSLLFANSGDDPVNAAFSALGLMKKEVHAIVGPQSSTQAKFVIELGNKAQVPIISPFITSPYISPSEDSYFIRTALADSSQLKALAAAVQAFGWWEIGLVYEDTDYGNGLIPDLSDTFQGLNIRIPYKCAIPHSANDTVILRKLEELKATPVRVFLVHMAASLGSKFFVLADNSNMMVQGYSWLITQGLSTLLHPINQKARSSMLGVLGVKPYISPSKERKKFRMKLRESVLSNKSTPCRIAESNLFAFWAYDTIWALGMAVEEASIGENYPLLNETDELTGLDCATFGGVRGTGPRLLNTILSTRFDGGLSTKEFHLVDGQLETSTFEIFNVVGMTERIIGYWTEENGISQTLDTNSQRLSTLASIRELKRPIWPGDAQEPPKKLRIGIPWRHRFKEFVNVDNKSGIISGFTIDMFKAAIDELPFPFYCEFVPSFPSYTNLLHQVKDKNLDAVVGDITITANRSTLVDFTLPYSESGVSMLVLMKDADDKENMWIFLKPLSWELWLTIGLAFVFTGLVVWVLEHRINTDFRGPVGQQVSTVLWFSFSTLVFAYRERVVNNLSRFVLIIWIFVVLILTQSYTASLTSMLTVQRLQPSFVDTNELIRRDLMVGYTNNSFLRELLKELGFNERKMKPCSTAEDIYFALAKGEVSAFFDESPYIKLFLSDHCPRITKQGRNCSTDCSRFSMIGPTYKTAGFGFAFPMGSPLVPYFSRAILNVTQDKEKFDRIEKRNFVSLTTFTEPGAPIASESSSSLGIYSFAGLFIITGAASSLALSIHVVIFLYTNWPASSNNGRSFWLTVVGLVKLFDQKELSLHNHLSRNQSRVHPVTTPKSVETDSSFNDHSQNHIYDSNEVEENIVINGNSFVVRHSSGPF